MNNLLAFSSQEPAVKIEDLREDDEDDVDVDEELGAGGGDVVEELFG